MWVCVCLTLYSCNENIDNDDDTSWQKQNHLFKQFWTSNKQMCSSSSSSSSHKCVCVLFVCVCVCEKKIESDTFVNVHVSCWEKSRFVCCFRIILSFTRIWFPFFLILSFSVHSFYYLQCAYRITQLCKRSHTQHTHSHL